MTSVATISASTAAEAAAFTGPARSTDSSGQFATELNKTTQQVRERHDGQQPAHSNRSVDRQVDRAVENMQSTPNQHLLTAIHESRHRSLRSISQ